MSTWATGVLVVLGFHGANVALGDSTLASVLDIALGSAALGLVDGHAPRLGEAGDSPRSERAVDGESRTAHSALARPLRRNRGRHGSLSHTYSGVVYLLALNAIATQQPPVVDAGLQVAVYNALWFLVPPTSLVLVIVRPGAALQSVETATAWVRRHEHAVLVVGLVVVGGYFVVKGTVNLLT